MLVCAECGTSIEDGQAHVERVDDPDNNDTTPELAFWCAACAYVEFVTGTGPTQLRVPRVRG